MKIKIWTVTSNAYDGSYTVMLYPTREKAIENLDEDECIIYEKGSPDEWKDEQPSEVSYTIFDTEGCEILK